MNIFVRTTAAAILVATVGSTPLRADDTGFANSHAMVKSGGMKCFADHAHSGSGDGKTKPAAMSAALKNWYAYTAGEYGSDWARWAKSAGKRVTYTKAADGWTATVESRPCK